MRTFLKRKLSNDFNVFFCFLTNSVFVKQNYVWVKYDLPAQCFYNRGLQKKNNNILLNFFNNFSKFWVLAWKFVTLNNNLLSGFFVELELIGLGFRIRKITSTVYRFFWGYATFVYLFVPSDLLVEYSFDDRTILFFGINVLSVNSFSSFLMLLKKLSTYRITGFIRPGKIIRLNSGKQR